MGVELLIVVMLVVEAELVALELLPVLLLLPESHYQSLLAQGAQHKQLETHLLSLLLPQTVGAVAVAVPLLLGALVDQVVEAQHLVPAEQEQQGKEILEETDSLLQLMVAGAVAVLEVLVETPLQALPVMEVPEQHLLFQALL